MSEATLPKRGNRFEDLTGRQFGRLTVERFDRRDSTRGTLWSCRCSCGQPVTTSANRLKGGRVKSCGCLKRELAGRPSITHGRTRTRLYSIWRNILTRCCDVNAPTYAKYGARGITICDRWKNSFESFLADMGDPPTDRHTIDRYPDKCGNYEPGNCRWATMKQQNRNRKNNHLLTFGGRTLCIAEWAEELGMRRSVIESRISHGWSVERALTERPNPKRVAARRRRR